MDARVEVRSYDRRDRSAVRTIACDTAFRGRPIEQLFSDRETVADLLTRYYTDYEPGSVWVAECEGRVVGYLTGCLRSQRYRQVMMWRVVPRAALGAIGRGALWSWHLWRLARAAVATWWHGGFRRHIPLARYPAHLHVNMQEGFRGQGVGRRLLERFCAQVATTGVGGIHAAVREENVPACALFEGMGFLPLNRHPVVLPDGTTYRRTFTVVYGKRV